MFRVPGFIDGRLERQNLLEVAGTAKSSSKRQKLLKSLIPSSIGKGLVTNNKSRHAPLACSKQKWRTTRRLLRFSAFQTKLFQDLNLPM